MACSFVRRSLTRLAVAACLCAVVGASWNSWAADVASPTRQPVASPADAITGDWRPSDMPDVDVRIFLANGKYVGGIVKAANPALVNTEMLREIEYVPASQSWKGEVFALKRGMFVPMTIRMTGGGFEMVAGSGILSKTIEWVRIGGTASNGPQPAP